MSLLRASTCRPVVEYESATRRAAAARHFLPARCELARAHALPLAAHGPFASKSSCAAPARGGAGAAISAQRQAAAGSEDPICAVCVRAETLQQAPPVYYL